MRNGPFTIDEVYDRIGDTLNLPDSVDPLFGEFVMLEQPDETALIDLAPIKEVVDGKEVYRVSVNLSESGNELASATFDTEEQATQVIDFLLFLAELSEHGLH